MTDTNIEDDVINKDYEKQYLLDAILEQMLTRSTRLEESLERVIKLMNSIERHYSNC